MTVAQLKERMDTRFKTVGARFDTMDARFDTMDARFDALDAQFRQLFRIVAALGEKVDTDTQRLTTGVGHCLAVVNEHEKRIREIEPPPVQGAPVPGRG